MGTNWWQRQFDDRPDLLVPFPAYPPLLLGIHLPFQKMGARNDYSYGVDIYAYPVQQLLATWNVQRWSYSAFLFFSAPGVAPFAIASWWLVEKRALRLKRVDLTPRSGAAHALSP